MKALARFIMAGPSQAAMVAAVTAILALLAPPLAWVSGAVIALVVLHLGPQRGGQVIVFAGLAAMGLSWLALGTPLLALGVILLQWMPVWIAAFVLRQTVSLALSLKAIAGMGILLVLVMQLAFPNMQSEIGSAFTEMLQPAIEQQQTEETKQALRDAIAAVLPIMPGLLATGIAMGAVLSLLLGRWWQAALYNPGGLAKEFNELRMGTWFAGVAAAITGLALVTSSPLATMLALVLLATYLIQGLALIHGAIEVKQINKVWLFGLYVSIFLLPQMVILPLAVFGIMDAWIDFRRRLTS